MICRGNYYHLEGSKVFAPTTGPGPQKKTYAEVTKEKLSKKYNVSQLKQILRDNKEKCKFVISGNKKEIIHRIISWGLISETPENFII